MHVGIMAYPVCAPGEYSSVYCFLFERRARGHACMHACMHGLLLVL